MTYYLANMKVKGVGEDVFGVDINKMSFRYNKKYRYWYKVTEGDIIQFLGLKRYYGGLYDLSFVCQPLFIPICLSILDDKRGAAPSLDAEEGSAILNNMIYLRQFSPLGLPKLKGIGGGDSIDDIEQHMHIVFDVVIKPVFEKSIDVLGCYKEFKRIRSIRKAVASRHIPSENWTILSRIASPIDILTHLHLHNYDEALRYIKEDMAARQKGGNPSPYAKYITLAERRDDAIVSQMLQDKRSLVVNALHERGFIIP